MTHDEAIIKIKDKDLIAKGECLTNLAALSGLKRRWFGLEPDFILRKRILKLTRKIEDKGRTLIKQINRHQQQQERSDDV